MFELNNLPKTLDLCYKGENEVTKYQFDFTDWVETYGAGTFVIRHKRPTDANAYVVPSVTINENIATWEVTETDTAINGYGVAELWFLVGDKKKASKLIATYVSDSLAETGEVPEPIEDWLDQFTELKEEAETARDDAESYAEAAEQSAQAAYDVFSFIDDGNGNITIERANNG